MKHTSLLRNLILLLLLATTALCGCGKTSALKNKASQQQEQALLNAIEKNDNNSESYNKLGMLYSKEGLLDMALPYFEKAYQINTDEKSYALALALCLEEMKEYEKAKEVLLAIGSKHPKESELHRLLGHIAYSTLDIGQATQSFEKLLEISYPQVYKKHPDSMLSLAFLYLLQEDHTKAERILRATTKHNPSYAPALYLWGHLYTLQGKHKASLLCFEKASSMKKDYELWQLARGKMYTKLGADAHAIKLFNSLATGPSRFKDLAQVVLAQKFYGADVRLPIPKKAGGGEALTAWVIPVELWIYKHKGKIILAGIVQNVGLETAPNAFVTLKLQDNKRSVVAKKRFGTKPKNLTPNRNILFKVPLCDDHDYALYSRSGEPWDIEAQIRLDWDKMCVLSPRYDTFYTLNRETEENFLEENLEN